jgi:hypothetical protein
MTPAAAARLWCRPPRLQPQVKPVSILAWRSTASFADCHSCSLPLLRQLVQVQRLPPLLLLLPLLRTWWCCAIAAARVLLLLLGLQL